jgi:translation initiation factor IF-2
MSTKIADLAEKLELSVKDLKEKLMELGVEVAPRARVIDDETAELVIDELSSADENASEGDEDIADIYDEMIAEEREREIVKSQRKQTAGRDDKKKKKDEGVKVSAETIAPGSSIEIPESISVKEFGEKTGLNVAKIIGELMKNGVLANINQQIDFETAQVIAVDLGVKIKKIRDVAGAEEIMSGDIAQLIQEDEAADLEERPPVICVMGHVDHGKTQLLDTIRNANVVSGESGGITQHIGAYQVEKKGQLLTFLDTPGHEAFTAMRARGAKVTDIAILVVAADEGMKPQTIEAMNHAKEAEVPIIVAINKIDKPNANIEKVKGELTEHGLQPEEWGGKTICVPVSALKGDGIDDLLDMIVLTAEMDELKANPNREAVATVIEAHLDQSLGPVATVLVNTGTLKIMNNVVVGNTHGRIKLMRDHNGKALRTAGPAKPVFIAGLNKTPKSGDLLQVVQSERVARMRAEEIGELGKEESMRASGAGLVSQIKSHQILKLIVKADAKGSLEAIKQSIAKIKDEEVAIKVIHSGVGRITESDVLMAAAGNALVASFHTDFDSPLVARIADRGGVEVRHYKVIYDLLEDLKKILSGLLEAELLEIQLGRATVKQVFFHKRKDMIVGCKVLSGKLQAKAKLKIIRGMTKEDEENIVGEGVIDSLRKGDDVVKEIKEGNDCGIKYRGEVVLEEGDILMAYKEEQKFRTIE